MLERLKAGYDYGYGGSAPDVFFACLGEIAWMKSSAESHQFCRPLICDNC